MLGEITKVHYASHAGNHLWFLHRLHFHIQFLVTATSETCPKHIVFTVPYASNLVTRINHLTCTTEMLSKVISLLPYCLPPIFSPKGSQYDLHNYKCSHHSPLLESVEYLLNELNLKKSSIYFIAPCVTWLLVITTKIFVTWLPYEQVSGFKFCNMTVFYHP